MTKKRLKNKFLIEQLEQRLLFSADFEPISLDSGGAVDTILLGSSVEETTLLPSASGSHDTDSAEQKRQEILFMDSSISDYRQLVDDVLARSDDGRSIEVVVLDINKDGILQISETLGNYKNLDAVHIVSHGDDGAIRLGNDWLMKETIDDYADSIEGWKQALTDEADILFYGCNLASGEEGRVLIEYLSLLTGADVAASDDLTGNAAMSGDWLMEYTRGKIEAEIAISRAMQLNWQGLLDDTGFKNPSSTGSVDTDWTNAANAYTSNNLDARTSGNADKQDWSNFNLGLPTGSTITGIQVDIEGRNAGDEGGVGVDIELSWDGGATWTSSGYGAAWPDEGSDAYKTFGGAVDTWGRAWTETDFSDTNFSVKLKKKGSNEDTFEVDHIRAKVFYYHDTYYLDGVGDGSDLPNALLKTTAPTDPTLDNFDPGRDSFAGLLVKKGGKLNESDPEKHQLWITGTDGISLSGSMNLTLWSASKDFNTGEKGEITAYLVDSNFDGSDVTEIASATITRSDWDVADSGTWIEDTFNFGNVTYNLGAGRYLGVKVVVNDNDMWLAYDATTQPSRLDVTNFNPTLNPLWFSTLNDVTSSGAPGLDSWDEHDVITFGDPGFSLGPGVATSGTLISAFDLELFQSNGGSPDINGLHYMKSSFTIGSGGPATEFTFQEGDLLITVDGGGGFTFDGLTTSITVQEHDVFVFRPQGIGDYSDGEFYYLLDDPLLGEKIKSVAIVESASVTIGDGPALTQGTFLLTLKGAGDNDRVMTFLATTVGDPANGGNTSGAPAQILIEGSDGIEAANGGNLNFSQGIFGIHLIESNTVVGGVNFQEGDLLLTLNNSASVSTTLPVTENDVFRLRMSETRQGSNHRSVGVAEMVFEGSAVGIDSDKEDLDALTMLLINKSPTDVSISASTIDENVDTSVGSSIGTLTSTDPDSVDTFTYSVVGGADQGNFSIGGAGSDELILTAGILDFEAKSIYEVIVRTTDSGGSTFDKTITVTVNDLNEDPTDVSISASTIDENIDISGGSSIGTLSSTDPDTGDIFTYSVVGGAEQGNFSIGGAGSDELILTAGILNFEAKSSYEVIVRTTDNGGLTYDKTITVTVNDLNEDPTDVSISSSDIDENVDTSGGTSIGILTSSDPDLLDSFTYSVVGGADQGSFSIGGAGSDELILTAGILNFEAKSSYEVIVRTADSGGLTFDKTITVTVNDLNEDPTDIDISANTIDENIDTSGGTSIGTLSTFDSDAGDTFTYSVVGGADQGSFSIGGAGSDELVLTAGILNFEAKSSYEVIVRTADSGGLTFDKTITISVNDLNEDPTSVSVSSTSINDGTDTSGGTTLGTLSTTDPDTGDTFAYSVVGGADQTNFSIGGAGSDELIMDDGILNMGSQASYEIIVRTTDSGGLTHDETITITVDNVPDPPTDISISTSTIDENIDTSGGTSIGTLTSFDPDLGDTFTYSLVGGTDQGNFSIGGAGSDELILTAGILNFESKSSYEVIVRTTDSGGLTFDKTITVTVNDLNEDPTDISISAVTIDENIDTSGGRSIGTLSSSDPDFGDSFTYSVVGGAEQGNFTIGGSGSDELILSAGILNYEAKSSYEVIVRTTDSGGLTVDKTITVTVNNINDDPTDVSISASDIDENIDTSGGSSIGTMTSTDQDSGETFTYSVVGGADQGNFSIGGAGSDELILTAGILNFESKSSYEVIVRTTDSGGLTFDKTITVTVNDLNEEPTDISISAVTIDENVDTSGGSSIGTLTSSDPDSGDTFTYSVVGGADQGNFSIGGAGSDELILTAGILNFEAKSSYEVIFRTTDSGGLTFDKTITVTVNDLNEDPTDISISASDIDENINTFGGASIGTLTSTDPDLNETFTYSVVGGTNQSMFSIGGAGSDELILTAGMLNHEVKSSYEVIVRTTDSGGLTFDKTITVTVNDLNEDPTDIDISANTIDENIDTTGGTSIGTLNSFDPDTGETFTYSIVGGADQTNFSIGGAGSDELIIDAGVLNYETKASYEVIVRTTDSGGLTFDKTIIITVNNANDAPTAIDLNNSSVDENDAGAVIGNLTTSEPDSGDTHTYSIDDGRFEIVGNKLRLKAGQSLDRETEPTVDVVLTSTDFGGLSISSTFTITVINVNEAPTGTNLNAPETFSTGTPLNLTDIVVFDVDSATVTVKLKLSDPAAGTLSTGKSGVVKSTYNPATGVWKARGAIADVNALLAGVVFTPDDSFDNDFTITAIVKDGKVHKITGIKNMTFIPVIDPPSDPGPVEELPEPEPEAPEEPAEDIIPDDPLKTIGSGDEGRGNDPLRDPAEKKTSVSVKAEGIIGSIAEQARANLRSVINDISSAYRALPFDLLSIDPAQELFVQEIFNDELLIKTYNRMRSSLDMLKEETSQEIQFDKMVVGSTIAASTGLSVGYVIWLIRSGMLLTSVLASMPAWQIADPLPILSSMRGDDDDDDESLEEILKKSEQNDDKYKKAKDNRED